jgi:asparagine synthase (glutamine-hydrolysing)
MFAFALWDRPRRRLLIARDRLGKKPLYYALRQGTLYFGSELRAVLAALPDQPEIDLEAIDLYLSLQYIPDPLTAYKGIYKLPAAHTLTWESGTVHIRRYWDYSPLPKWTQSEPELAEELRGRLREAVKMRLISEVPLGAHLSGGIDSSIIVALMAESGSGRVKTFSAGFEEEGFSELPYARLVAERYGTEHHEFMLAYGELPTTLERIARHMGEPFADPSAIPLLHLSLLTREHVTVALNGDGGDEDFAGYQRYAFDRIANLYLRAPTFLTNVLVPALVNRLPDRPERPVGDDIVASLRRLAQIPLIDSRASILRWSSYFLPHQRAALWRNGLWQTFRPDNAQALIVSRFDAGSGSFLDRTLYADVQTYLPGDLLVKADRMTMAASLEGRSPFLDHELVEWAARLPDDLRVRGWQGKYLLRRAFGHMLPARVLGHRKQGFGIPVSAWFRGPLYEWGRSLLHDGAGRFADWFNRDWMLGLLEEHHRKRADHGKRLYALAMLAIWARDLTAAR